MKNQEYSRIKHVDALFGETVDKRRNIIEPSADLVAQLEQAYLRGKNTKQLYALPVEQPRANVVTTYKPDVDRDTMVANAQNQVADSQPKYSDQYFVDTNNVGSGFVASEAVQPAEDHSYPDLAAVWNEQRSN